MSAALSYNLFYDPADPWPDSDGRPMAENTKQYKWLVKIKENLEILFARTPDVFVAGDLFWYPQPDRLAAGDLLFVTAPDVLVAFGRPKGDRGSYKQWEEDGIPPQVVFEILSPGNRKGEMEAKLAFYQYYGVEEYYLYDPDTNTLTGRQRQGGRLVTIPDMHGWCSPRLGIRFEPNDISLEIYRPDGRRFLSSVDLSERVEQERVEKEQAHARAEQERLEKEQAHARAEQERLEKEQAHARAEQERLEKEQAHARAEQERLEKEQAHARAEAANAQAEAARAHMMRMAEYMRKMGLDPDDV